MKLLAAAFRLRASGTERAGPCPVCGGHDRFAINVKKQTWNCRGCGKGGGDAISLAMHMDGSNFPGAVKSITASAELPAARPAQAPTKPEQSSPDNAESRVQDALDIFDAAADLRGTLGEDYLRRDRELETADNFSSFLRWDAWKRALIGLFRDICTDEPRAITRIFLDADGHKITRKFLGPVGGCAIKIDPDEDVTMGVCIGEGLETCLAARQLGLRPVWALGSVGGISKFPVLAGIDALTILEEFDDSGANARAVDVAAGAGAPRDEASFSRRPSAVET